MNNWFLYLVTEAMRSRITGRTIIRSRLFHALLTLELSSASHEPRIYLTIILTHPGPFLFLAARDWLDGCPAVPTFGQITGCTIDSAGQLDGDRIAYFDLARPNGGRQRLCFYLFGVSVDSEIRSLEPSVSTSGHIVSNSEIPMPTAPAKEARIPFGLITGDDILAMMTKGQPLHRDIPGAETVLLESFMDKGRRLDVNRLIAFRERIHSGQSPIHIAFPKNLLRKAVPVPESAWTASGRHSGPFTDAVGAAEAVGSLLVKEAFSIIVEKHLAILRQKLRALENLLEKLTQDKDDAAQHVKIRREAEVLAAYQSRIRKGAKYATLPDPYRAGESIELILDPTQSVHEQVQRRFKKAIKLERSMQHISKRMEDIENDIKFLDGTIKEILSMENMADALNRIYEVRAKLKLAADRRPGSRREDERRYRKYDLDGTWFVLVGRNNKENDELTFHTAAPTDLWFHAQSVAGSHVVLKSKGSKAPPSRTVLQAAAEIAAYFSKARHSSLVPVIYTQRKYVRKPRKAKPGQVVCENEKTIFAEPKRPRASGDEAE